MTDPIGITSVMQDELPLHLLTTVLGTKLVADYQVLATLLLWEWEILSHEQAAKILEDCPQSLKRPGRTTAEAWLDAISHAVHRAYRRVPRETLLVPPPEA